MNRFYFFPSVATAWRITLEPFLDGLSRLCDLRLRARWARTGYTAIDPGGPGAFGEALAEPGNAHAVYLHAPMARPLVLDVPAGHYDAARMDTLTGRRRRRRGGYAHAGGRLALGAPPYPAREAPA